MTYQVPCLRCTSIRDSVIGSVLVHPWQCRMCVSWSNFHVESIVWFGALKWTTGSNPYDRSNWTSRWLAATVPLHSWKSNLGSSGNKVPLNSTVESCFGIRFASGTHGYTPFADIPLPLGKVRTWASVPMDHNNFRYETNHFGAPFSNTSIWNTCAPLAPAIQAHRRRQREIGHPCEVVVGELRNQDRVPGGTTTKKTCSYGSYGSNHSYHLKD